MAATTPFFKAFGPLLFGRPTRNAAAKIKAGVQSLGDLYELFGGLFSEKLFALEERGLNSRERVFSPQVTFWAFVAQVLSPDSPCREAVRLCGGVVAPRPRRSVCGHEHFHERLLSGARPAELADPGTHRRAVGLEPGAAGT